MTENLNIMSNNIDKIKEKTFYKKSDFKEINHLISVVLNKLPDDIILLIKKELNASLIQYHFRTFQNIKLLLYKYVDYLILKSTVKDNNFAVEDIFNPCKKEIFNLLHYINSILTIKEIKYYYWKNILGNIYLGFYLFEPRTEKEKNEMNYYYISKKKYEKILTKLNLFSNHWLENSNLLHFFNIIPDDEEDEDNNIEFLV